MGGAGMRAMLTIARRELVAYFSTPLAYVFIVAFLMAAGVATFQYGGFMERRQADLAPFFYSLRWLFLVLIPAVGMRLWADERRQGTIELLMTLPVTSWQAVTGKFLAAWAFIGFNLVLTFPIWLSVNYLGDPDNGVIAAGYLASFLLGGALLAVTSCVSALTKSQVIAFVFGVAASFLLMVSGLDLLANVFSGSAPPFLVNLVGAVSDWTPPYVSEVMASFSLLAHFDAVARGVLDVRAIVLFVALIVLFLFINRQVIEIWKA